MTKEEKEAIELATNFTKEDFSNPMGWSGYYDTELKELSQVMKIVLNLIQKQDKEIKHWKKGFERELEDNRKNTCELLKQDLIIRGKDKQIDLILDKINENYNKIFNNDEVKEIIEIYENIKDKNKLKGLDLRKECIKNFFERKSEK